MIAGKPNGHDVSAFGRCEKVFQCKRKIKRSGIVGGNHAESADTKGNQYIFKEDKCGDGNPYDPGKKRAVQIRKQKFLKSFACHGFLLMMLCHNFRNWQYLFTVPNCEN